MKLSHGYSYTKVFLFKIHKSILIENEKDLFRKSKVYSVYLISSLFVLENKKKTPRII